MAGTLFVVATPIGNLEDLTFRALRVLKEVDFIAAEDTRRTRKLLTHYGVSKPLTSLHEHNEHAEAPRLVERLVAGATVAVVSDAGTPGISDPGATLVRLARQAGVTVVPIPGPSAVTAALSISGLAFRSFMFKGFPPPSGTARTEWFESVADCADVVVFFESPHRISRTMTDLRLLVGKRQIETHREITKKFETLVISHTTSSADTSEDQEVGEFVVILGEIDESGQSARKGIDPGDVSKLVGYMTEIGRVDEQCAIKGVASALGIGSRDVRKRLKIARYARKQDEDARSSEDPEQSDPRAQVRHE
jgi:16S rRNA (cytidine1402-2'-O)-methyltransferase